ncbi:uncharacterized protein J3R85_005556 [Psidium guajava]|nr:uncharacterized protein J3R85_005556 [Psidium guajava]
MLCEKYTAQGLDHFEISSVEPEELCTKLNRHDKVGEAIVICFVDSCIYPHHLSFSSHPEPYGPLPKYRGNVKLILTPRGQFAAV